MDITFLKIQFIVPYFWSFSTKVAHPQPTWGNMIWTKSALKRSSFIFIIQWPAWICNPDLLKGCWLISHNSALTYCPYPSYSLNSSPCSVFLWKDIVACKGVSQEMTVVTHRDKNLGLTVKLMLVGFVSYLLFTPSPSKHAGWLLSQAIMFDVALRV